MSIVFLPNPELVDRLRAGEEVAFRQLFDRLHRRIYQFAFKFVKEKERSEEIVQDAFLNFWMNRAKLDRDKPVEPYLYAIARRTMIDHWRRAASTQRVKDELFKKAVAVHNETEETVLLRDLERITEVGMKKMNGQQQMVFALSRFDKLTYDEIAAQMGISRNTVKYHLMKALEIMREHFEKHDVSYFVLFCYAML